MTSDNETMISIHAPAGGATLAIQIENTEAILISIHAPAGGATTFPQASTTKPIFQFTPLREGRLAICNGGNWVMSISIHAPAGGATTTSCRKRSKITLFQFTPLREGRQIIEFTAAVTV
mgnify:CR=1 FL=1